MSDLKDPTKQDDANKFLDNMVSFGMGGLIDELAREQKNIIKAVKATRKMGKLTLELGFTYRGKQEIAVSAIVKTKIPRTPVESIEMFSDSHNDLYEENPEQLTFDNVTKIDSKREVNY